MIIDGQEIPAEKIKAYQFENGQVMVFDLRTEKQIPELQGDIKEVGPKLKALGIYIRPTKWG